MEPEIESGLGEGEGGARKSLGALLHSKVTAIEAVDDLYKGAMTKQRKLQNPMREHSSECERATLIRTPAPAHPMPRGAMLASSWRPAHVVLRVSDACWWMGGCADVLNMWKVYNHVGTCLSSVHLDHTRLHEST